MTQAERVLTFTVAGVVMVAASDFAPNLINGVLILVLVGVFLSRYQAITGAVQTATATKGN